MIHFVFIAQHFPWSHLIEYSNMYMFAIAIGELMRFSLFYHLTLLRYPFQMDCSNECLMLTVLHILWQSRPQGCFFSLSYDLHTAGFFGFVLFFDCQRFCITCDPGQSVLKGEQFNLHRKLFPFKVSMSSRESCNAFLLGIQCDSKKWPNTSRKRIATFPK